MSTFHDVQQEFEYHLLLSEFDSSSRGVQHLPILPVFLVDMRHDAEKGEGLRQF